MWPTAPSSSWGCSSPCRSRLSSLCGSLCLCCLCSAFPPIPPSLRPHSLPRLLLPCISIFLPIFIPPLLASQVPFVGFLPLKTSEHMASIGVCVCVCVC